MNFVHGGVVHTRLKIGYIYGRCVPDALSLGSMAVWLSFCGEDLLFHSEISVS